MRAVAAVALCAFALVAACDEARAPTPAGSAGRSSEATAVVDVRLQRVPKWMGGYCREATGGLGYPVLCPRRWPRPLTVIPCGGPDPKAEERWTEHCYDYVLESLFKGPPGYGGIGQGDIGRRTGHLAIWVIGPESDFYPEGFFACPGGGRRLEPDHLGGRSGSWWECPPISAGANLNSSHVGFQWRAGGVIYGLSLHGISAVNRQLVGRLLDEIELVRIRLRSS